MFKRNSKIIAFIIVFTFTFVTLAPGEGGNRDVFAASSGAMNCLKAQLGDAVWNRPDSDSPASTATYSANIEEKVKVDSTFKLVFEYGYGNTTSNEKLFVLEELGPSETVTDVSITVIPSPDKKTDNIVTIMPNEPLKYQKKYRLVLKAGIVDKKGRRASTKEYDFIFFTEGKKATLTLALLTDNVLTLMGLPQNADNLEYCFSDSTWKPLTVTGTEAVIDTTGLELIPKQSAIKIRTQGDPTLGLEAGEAIEKVIVSEITPPDAPEASMALLSVTGLKLTGLSMGPKNLEYRISQDGNSYNGWCDLNANENETSVLINVQSLSVMPGISKVQLRVKEDAVNMIPSGESRELTVGGALNTEIPLSKTGTYSFEGNINVTVNSLTAESEGKTPTITLRNAVNESPSGADKYYFLRFHPASEVYGFNIKGASCGSVTVSLPININPNGEWSKESNLNAQETRDKKVALYLLKKIPNYNGTLCTMWVYQSSTDLTDIKNNMIKVPVEISSENRDFVYAAFIDQYAPEANIMYFNGSDDRSISFRLEATDESNVARFNILRTDLTTREVKEITVTKSAISTASLTTSGITNDFKIGSGRRYLASFTDYDVVNDRYYQYQLLNVEDEFGNTSVYTSGNTKSAAIGSKGPEGLDNSDEAMLEKMKAELLPNVLDNIPPFVSGDSQDSVTQSLDWDARPFRLKWRNIPKSDISYESENKEIMPSVGIIDKSKMTGDSATVNIVMTMAYGTASYVHKIPLTVRWTEESVVDSDEELKAAINNPIVKTIKLCRVTGKNYRVIMGKHQRIDPNGKTVYDANLPELDFKGKTIKVNDGIWPPFMNLSSENYNKEDLSFKISNVVIDAGGGEGEVLILCRCNGDLTLENVKVINAENYKYIVSAADGKTTITNCTFGACKIASISKGKDMLNVSHCTLAGGGEQSGTGIQSYADTILNNNRLSDFRENAVSIGAGGSLTTFEGNSISGCSTAIQACIDSANSSYVTAGGIPITDKATAENAFKMIKSNNTITDISNTIAVKDGTQNIHNESSDIFSAAINPAASSTGVAISSKVGITFSKKMDASTINSNSIVLLENGKALAAKVTYDPETTTAAIEPATGTWKYNSTYSITLTKSVKDMDGKNLAVPVTWTFGTENYANWIPLMPTADHARDVEIDATLKIGFAKPVNGSSVASGAAVILQTANGSKVESENSLNPEGTILIIKPKKALDYGESYQIILPASLTDKDGRSEQSARVISFKTQTATIENFCLKNTLEGIIKADAVKPSIVKAGERYYMDYSVRNNSQAGMNYMMYMVVRGGKGAREDCGGQVIYNFSTDNGRVSYLPLYFTIPKDMTGNLYIDIFTRNYDSGEAQSKPVHYLYKIDN